MSLPRASGYFRTRYDEDFRLLDKRTQRAAFGLFALCALALPFVASPFVLDLANQVLLAVIGAVALMLLTGYAGQISLGHAGLLAAGAYTTGILFKELGAAWWVTLPCAAAVGALLGVIFGLPSLRLRGLYLAVSTLALHFIVIYLGNEYETKRGFSTGVVIDAPIADARAWYAVLFAAAAVAVLLALNLLRTKTGRAWHAIRGKEAVAEALGINIPAYKLLAFVISATLTSVAGCLFAYYRGLYWPADPATTGVFPIQIAIGDQSLHAVGAGMGFALQKLPHVAVAVVGDGATSEGDFLEALNFSGVFNAQAVLFVQNNQWAISVPRAQQTASQTLAQKGLAAGVCGVIVDGNDALAVYAVSHWAIERARSGRGPSLVEAVTYRIGAHTTADDPRRYQPPGEIDEWRQRDPLPRFRGYLERRGLWDEDAEREATSEALARIDRAVEEAEALPTPSLEAYVGIAT